jgi:hypothetical protein
MDPRVYLQVAGVLRREPQLDAAVGTNMSSLGVPSRILYGNSEQPVADWPLADLASVYH